MLRDAVGGDSLRVAVRAPEMTTARRGDVPVLDVAATFDEETGTGSVSIVNRDASKPVDVELRIADRTMRVTSATVLHAHPKAQNDWDAPNTMAPPTSPSSPTMTAPCGSACRHPPARCSS